MAALGLKEKGKIIWEDREKSLPNWLSQFRFAKLRQPTGQTFFFLHSQGKYKEKPGIPFWGWTPCLFPSKTCC